MRHRLPFALALSGLLSLSVSGASSPPASQTLDAPLQSRIDAEVKQAMQAYPYPGLALGVVIGDTLAHAAGYGTSNRATAAPVTPDTLFQIGSTGKSITATLLGILIDRGAMAITDPIAKHLPADVTVPAGAGGRAPTIHEVATHTSGLPRQPPTLRRKHGDYPVLAFTHFELYQSLAAAQLTAAPGARFDYSNFGYAVIGHLLERAAGKPYETLLKDELLDPLGMTSTTVTIWPELEPRLARPYYPPKGAKTVADLQDYTPWDMEAMAPAGGIASTVRDLAKYVSFHLREGDATRLGRDTARLLRQRHVQIDKSDGYGYGWFLSPAGSFGTHVRHGGEVDGYTSYLGFVPERGIGVIALTNVGAAPIERLGLAILRQVVEARAATPAAP